MSSLKILLESIRTVGRSALGRDLIPSPKKITLGVDIGADEVRIVKAARISNDRWKVLDCLRIPLAPGISRGDSHFHEFLRSSLATVSGLDGKFDLWTLISSANVDVRHIRIPKVPRAQIPNAVYWTVKRETNFNEKDTIIDFEVQGEVLEKGLAKIGVMACVISRKDLDEISALFSRSGLTVRGITATSFAIQNLFRSECAPRHDKPVGVLYIGNEHSRIDVFSSGDLVLTRGMKAGIDSMIEAFEEAYAEKQKIDKTTGEEPLTTYENDGRSREETKALLLGIFSGSFSPNETIGATGLREETVFEMVRPALDRLARQVERTFEYCSLTLGNDRVDTIYVSCAAGHWERPFDFIAGQLGVERKVLDPLTQGPILSDEAVVPATITERIPFTNAVGLSLSDNIRTPNLIFTYSDKEKLGKIARINRWIFCAFMAVIVVLTGVFFWQAHVAWQKEAEIVRLQAELDRYSPPADRNTIASLAAKVAAQRRALVERSNRLLGTAVIGELVSLTPPNVRLLSVAAVLGGKPDERQKKSAFAGGTNDPAEMKKEAKKSLVLEGIVTGRRDAREAFLAGYVMKLSASRLFVHPVVSSNTIESDPDEGEVLGFSLQIGLP